MWILRKDNKGEEWKGKSNQGEWGEEIIENYDEIKEIGSWGSVNILTNEVTKGGKILGQTIKYKDTDGQIKLGTTFEPQDLESGK
jgi:hypothetical protein